MSAEVQTAQLGDIPVERIERITVTRMNGKVDVKTDPLDIAYWHRVHAQTEVHWRWEYGWCPLDTDGKCFRSFCVVVKP